jgi:hypothetical protein
MTEIEIDEISLAAAADPWTACGFVVANHACQLGTVRLRLAGAPAQAGERTAGILGWSLRGVGSAELDGLPTAISHAPPPPATPAHPNGVLAIDHVVAMSPDLDRTVAALRAAGLDLRRVRDEPTPAGAPRQAFFRLGREILEVVQEPQEAVARGGGPDRPARLWGLAMIVEDLRRAVASLAPHVSEVRAAVQPGRQIATVRRSAGLGVPLALMSARESPPTPAAAATAGARA